MSPSCTAPAPTHAPTDPPTPPHTYARAHPASYTSLSATIEEQQLLPKEVFTSLLKKIYKRKK